MTQIVSTVQYVYPPPLEQNEKANSRQWGSSLKQKQPCNEWDIKKSIKSMRDGYSTLYMSEKDIVDEQ